MNTQRKVDNLGQNVQSWGSAPTGATEGDITKILCQLREYQDEIKYQTTQVDALATRVLGLEGSLENVAKARCGGRNSEQDGCGQAQGTATFDAGTLPSGGCGAWTSTLGTTWAVGTLPGQKRRCRPAYNLLETAAECTGTAAAPTSGPLKTDTDVTASAATTGAGAPTCGGPRTEPSNNCL